MINILIVDDHPTRYGRLVAELEKNGIERSQIDIAPSANAARTFLDSKYYDLLLLDILLPLWEEQEPSTQNSLDLLSEIGDAEYSSKPSRVIGITSDSSVAAATSSMFEDWTWTIVQYEPDSDHWMKRILNCINYVSQSETNEPRPKHGVDLAVVCALPKELAAVLDLPWNWSESRPLDDVTFVYDGYFHVNERKITVSATQSPRMGMVSAALKSSAIINLLKPRLIVMCGICAGVRGKVNIGDVIFADPTWDFQSGKRVKDKENTSFAMAPNHLSPSSLIRSHVEQLVQDCAAMSRIAANYRNPPSLPKIIIGPMASGSAVLADGEVIEDIKQQHRELLGVEMEAYGVFAAAYSSPRPQPSPFSLKAVCDFADPDKADQHQDFATYTSARVLELLMEKFGPRLLE